MVRNQVLKSSLETDGVERVTAGLGDVHVAPHTANDVLHGGTEGVIMTKLFCHIHLMQL